MNNIESPIGLTKKSIVFLCPYPFDTVGGQRFRYEQYLDVLKSNGFKYKTLAFLDKHSFSILYKQGHWIQKIMAIIAGFCKRIFHIKHIIFADYVFVYREVTPIGFPVFEWIIAKVLKKKLIYDFDDAIWLSPTSSQNEIISKLKYPGKVGLICKWSYKVSVGNSYLKSYVLKYNTNVIINPTTIDTESYHNKIKDQNTNELVIGWTGTHSTLIYLDIVFPALKKLEQSYDFIFEVIADKEVQYDLKRYSFKKWSKKTEIEDLLRFNIGLMPLTDDEWSSGKCGFKALQYMSLAIPSVASPVGVNSDIIKDGTNGYLCKSEDEWVEKLSLLITDRKRRDEFGKAGMDTVKSSYSLKSNADNFVSLFS